MPAKTQAEKRARTRLKVGRCVQLSTDQDPGGAGSVGIEVFAGWYWYWLVLVLVVVVAVVISTITWVGLLVVDAHTNCKMAQAPSR